MATTEKRVPFGDVEWVITIQDRIDVEWVVEQQMKAAAFHVRLGTPYAMGPVDKAIKDALLKGGNLVI